MGTRLREPQYCIVNSKSDTAVRNTGTMNITKNYPCNTLINGQHKNPFDQKAELGIGVINENSQGNDAQPLRLISAKILISFQLDFFGRMGKANS